jgi:DNA (cytosine-5)-methyltransferase 1
VIVDIGMRMLQPRELFRAHDFPDSYVIERGADGEPMTKEAQVRMCGNSVPPPMAEAIIRAAPPPWPPDLAGRPFGPGRLNA